MKSYLLSLLILVSFINCGCNLTAALIMSIPQKQGKEKWVTENYRVKLKKRQDWAGPPYYHFRFKKKGLLNRRYKTTVGAYARQECIYYIPQNGDSVKVDFCNHTANGEVSKKLKLNE